MFLIDGQPTDRIAADDRGLAYGDGLFETLAVRDGAALALDQHLGRLRRDAARLQLDVIDDVVLRAEIKQLCAAGAYDYGVLKIILTRGSGGRGYRAAAPREPRRLLSLTPWPHHLEHSTAPALRAFICHHPLSINPVTAGIKHLNRLDQVLASREWPSTAYFEGLMRDVDGRLVEGTRSNLFLRYGAQLVTPDLGRCGVRGIIRDAVIDYCAQHDRELVIRDVDTAELNDADEVFITNSIIGVRALDSIDDMPRYRADAVCAGEIAQALHATAFIV